MYQLLSFEYLNNLLSTKKRVPSHGIPVGRRMYAMHGRKLHDNYHDAIIIRNLVSRYNFNAQANTYVRVSPDKWVMEPIALLWPDGEVAILKAFSPSQYQSKFGIQVKGPKNTRINYVVNLFGKTFETGSLDRVKFNTVTRTVSLAPPIERKFNVSKQKELNALIRKVRFILKVRQKLGLFSHLDAQTVSLIVESAAKAWLDRNPTKHPAAFKSGNYLPVLADMRDMPRFHREMLEKIDENDSSTFNDLIAMLFREYWCMPYLRNGELYLDLYKYFERYLKSKNREILRRAFGAVEIAQVK